MRRNPLLMTVMGNPCHGGGYRSNPFILIDSATNKIIRTWRGSMTDKKPWQWATDAARRLGRSVFVVAHPYVPPTFRAGVEVSPLFYFGGPYQMVHPDGTMGRGPEGGIKRNPGFAPAIAGSIAGSLVAHAMSNPRRKPKYASICRLCVYDTHPLMLTTYSIHSQKCDRCGNYADLAMVDMSRIQKRNPLTRAEEADILRSARHDLGYAAKPAKGKADRDARRFYAGRAVGKAWAAKMHGPAREHSGAESVFRRGYTHGMAKNPGSRRKVTMPIEKFARLVKAQNDPALWRDFVAKCKAYHKWSHGTWPKKATIEAINKPGMKGMFIVFDMGRQPESTYVMPKGSKRKGAWKHEWEGMPSMKGDPQAGLIITKLGKGNRLTDFLHG